MSQSPSRPISAYGYEQSKALLYSEHGAPNKVLSLHPHSLSPPHGNLVTLRTLTSPLNPADINQIQGTYPSTPPFTTQLGTPQSSAVPGNEALFSVLSAGSGVKNLKRGDWVIPARTGLGCWRTHVQCPEDAVIKINKDSLEGKGLEKAVGSVSVNPITAWRMLVDFWPRHLQEGVEKGVAGGKWYIQNGANSAVGRLVLQLGKLWGLKGIAVIRSRKEGEEELRKEMMDLGAEKVVTDTEVQEKGFKEQVVEWTGGEPLLLGLNCVGGDAAMGMAKVLGKGGTLVTYGAMGRKPLMVGASMLIFKDLRFVGFWISAWADDNREGKRETVEKVLKLYREGKLKDGPYEELKWNWDTKQQDLVDAVQGTLEGYRKGKGIFVYGDT